MPRDIPIGNGRLLVAFDFDYQIRDLYFPRVGKENHALGHPWRLGIWIDGSFSWVGRQSWRVERDYLPDTLVTRVRLAHRRLPLELEFNDLVDYERDVLLRRVAVRNLGADAMEVRLFFHADLNVLENEIGDTVFFDPKNACLVHYKGPRYFLMSCATEEALGVRSFATGRKRQPGLSGTWKDAEDGELSGNPITQGAVDSVVGARVVVAPGGESLCHYWLVAGTSYREVEALHRFVAFDIGPERLRERNCNYWRHWLSARDGEFDTIPVQLRRQYRRSLLIMRTQIDQGGAVIAANDTDIWQFNLDTYSYMWPRDGAITAQTLDRAGYSGFNRRFLEFCTERAMEFNYSASILSETGFLMHKYNPDGSVGSSWHPWIADDEIQFPIQEDETALVVWDVWQHYRVNRDIDAVRPFYDPFVRRAADFMLGFRDERTGLPLPCYDLWEESRGVFSFTTAVVVAGLRAAAALAELFNDEACVKACREGAAQVRAAMDRHLYCPKAGRFARGILNEGGVQLLDTTVDASLLGLVIFGAYPADDPRVAATIKAVEERLWVGGAVGGVARYEGDGYQRTGGYGVPGNPWVISTMWLAQCRIAAARSPRELATALPLLSWAVQRALPSGVLPEQVEAHSGEFLSVSPLTWSHATFVAAMIDYIEKRALLRKLARSDVGTERFMRPRPRAVGP